jgi:hypothetical protein
MRPKTLAVAQRRNATRLIAVALTAVIALAAMPASAALRLYTTTVTNRLLVFYSDSSSPIAERAITGLAAGETIAGLDFRPSTGELYGAAKSANGIRFVKIDVVTGAVTIINAQPLVIPGIAIGFSFEPSGDRIRLVSSADVNLRINPTTGQVANTDTPLAYVTGDPHFGAQPRVVNLAHRQQSPNLQTPVYGIDVGTKKLVRLGDSSGTPASISSGQLTTIGPIGVTPFSEAGGFDIDPKTRTGFVIVQSGQTLAPARYQIDLATGEMLAGSTLDSDGDRIDGLAIAQIDECADLDGNGKVDALTDGLLYMRALFGLTGTAVTNGGIGPGAMRTNWSQIQSYMNVSCGMTWAR